jgi:hypothetical protein
MSGYSIDPQQPGAAIDLTAQLDELPDGEPSLMLGQARNYAAFNHRQGENPEHFQLDCGLMSVQDVLRQFGAQVTESDIVEHALQRGECSVDPAAAERSGGTTPSEDARILTEYGVPSRAESGLTLTELAALAGHSHGVIIGVNCGILWQAPEDVGNGSVNHAVTVTGVALDPQDQNIQGFYINDSGNGKSAEFVRAVLIRVAWQDTGGWTIVTDAVHLLDQGRSRSAGSAR